MKDQVRIVCGYVYFKLEPDKGFIIFTGSNSCCSLTHTDHSAVELIRYQICGISAYVIITLFHPHP